METEKMTMWDIAARVTNSRSLLEMAVEYLLSGSVEKDPAERLETVLYAIEKARDEARAAEEALLNYPQPRAEQPAAELTQEDEETIDGTIYGLFMEAVDEEAERAEADPALTRFMEFTGCKEKSPLYMMYSGFRHGILKGLELPTRGE